MECLYKTSLLIRVGNANTTIGLYNTCNIGSLRETPDCKASFRQDYFLGQGLSCHYWACAPLHRIKTQSVTYARLAGAA